MRILIIDDHPAIRESIRMCLAGFPGMEIMPPVPDGYAGLLACQHVRPDFVLLELQMSNQGFETARALQALHPGVCLLGITSELDPVLEQCAKEAGFYCVIPKDRLSEYLIPATFSA